MDNVKIHSGTVIGADGFGFVKENQSIIKIPQTGDVVIESNVEIGSNCSIDRATIGSTLIGESTKIDNLVHIAHNVKIGKNCFITAQVGIAGSTVVDDYCSFGGQTYRASMIFCFKPSTCKLEHRESGLSVLRLIAWPMDEQQPTTHF